MNIQLQPSFFKLKAEFTSQPKNVPSPAVPAADCDTVIFSMKKPQLSESDFRTALVRRLTTELETETATKPEKLMRLHQEVSEGTYHVDSERIAQKILGY